MYLHGMVMAAKQNLILGGPGIFTLVSKPCRVSETEVLDMALTSTRGGFGAAGSVRLQSVPTAPSVETRFLGLGAFVFAWRLRRSGAYMLAFPWWWDSSMAFELNFVTPQCLRPFFAFVDKLGTTGGTTDLWDYYYGSVLVLLFLLLSMKLCKSKNFKPLFEFGQFAKLFQQARRHLVEPGGAHVSVLYMVRS